MKRSAQACARCRQLKMKCNGVANPPCQRCRLRGRECRVEPYSSTSDTTGNRSGRKMWSNNPPAPGKRLPANNRDVQSDILEERTNGRIEDAERMGVVMGIPEASPTPMPGGIAFCYYQPPGPPTPGPSPATNIGCPEPAPITLLSSTIERTHSKDHGSCEPQIGNSDIVTNTFNPYRTVQDLEAENSASTEPSPMACPIKLCDYSFLSEVDLSFSDAQQMFCLFGQCLASFIPPLHDTDFSTLPAEPLFILSTLYAVARYLPGTADLRSRLHRALRERLNYVLFQSQPSNWEDGMWTMKGLIVLYAYSEVLNTREGASEDWGRFDCWAVRAIAEGWAVKMKLGTSTGIGSREIANVTCWLWLYTMGHHMSVVQGCGKAMWAGAGIRKASSILGQCATSSRVKKMLGEVDLCILCENIENYQGPDVMELAKTELAAWLGKWGTLLQTHEGKSLYFHLHFTTFYLHTYLLQLKTDDKSPSEEGIAAAHAFLGYNAHLSPIDKNRLRYMSDFGFVMLAFVCIFVLRTLYDSSLEVHGSISNTELMENVGTAATLMGSFGPSTVRPGIYGTKIAGCIKVLRARYTTKDRLAALQPVHSELWRQQVDATDTFSNNLLAGKDVSSALQVTGDTDLLNDLDWDGFISNFEGLQDVRALFE